MALPTSGRITVKDIVTEMGKPTRTNVSLNTLAKEWYDYTGNLVFAKSEHKLSDWRGLVWRPLLQVLSIKPTQIERVPINGGTYSIAVTANGPWTASITRGGTEATLSSASGNGNGYFRLTVKGWYDGGIDQLQYLSGDVTVRSGTKSVVLRWYRSDLLLEEELLEDIR